jgi:hypothetical protein
VEQPVRRDAAGAHEPEAAGELADVAPPFGQPIAGLAERCPGIGVAECFPRGRTRAPQIVGAEQHLQRVIVVPRVDQGLGIGDEGPEPIGVDVDRSPVELDATGAGDRNPVQRGLQSEEAMEPRQS